MSKPRTLTLLAVVAHGGIAVWHLWLAAQVLPAPNNRVSWVAVALITLGHAVVSIALWKLGNRLTGLVSLLFFLAALGADLYEHFLHASANNVFMVAPGAGTVWFDTSVLLLVVFELLGCFLAIRLLGGGTSFTGNHGSSGAAAQTLQNGASGPKPLRASGLC